MEDTQLQQQQQEKKEQSVGYVEESLNEPLIENSTETATVDKLYIASKLGLETSSLETINNDILMKIKTNFDQFEVLKSEKLVLEMNLEQLNHVSNKKFEIIKNKVNKLTTENSSLQESVNLLKESKTKSDEKLSSLEIENTSFLKKLQEKDELISTIEKEKIHSFEIIKRREDEVKNLNEELAQLSKNNKDLRKELLELETSTQRSSSELLKLKFEKNNLNQELEVLKKNSSWYENELNKKMEELKTFKVDKYKEFSAIQLDLDSTKSELQSLQSKYSNLKQNFDSNLKKFDDSLITIKSLNDKIAYNQEDFMREMSSKDKLIEILSKSNEERRERVEVLQASLDSIKSDGVNDFSDLKNQLDEANRKIANSNLKIQQLENTIDELTSSPHVVNNFDSSMISQAGSVPSTPKIFKQLQQQQQSLLPSAQQTLTNIGGGGISLTQLYSDFQLLKKQLIKEKRMKENLERQVNQFVDELNKQVPAISATKERCSILELELSDISILLEKTSKEKDLLFKENKNWSKKLSEYELELNTLNKSRVDLSRQISHLVIQLSLKLEGDFPLTPKERESIDKMVGNHLNGYDDESDTDKLITERLVKFNSVVDLTTKNQELLKITRQLGNKLEEQEKLSQEKMDTLESVAIDEAREAIIALQEQISSVETQLNSVTRERDMFRSIAGGHKQQQQPNVFNSTPNTSSVEIREVNDKQKDLAVELMHTQDEFKIYKQETESTIKTLNKQNNELSNAKSNLAVKLAKAISSSQLLEERNKSLQETLKYSKSEADEIRKRSNMLQDSLSKHDVANLLLTEELIQIKSVSETLNLEISNLRLEKQLWKSIEKRLNEENSSLLEERLRLTNLTSDLQRLENEREQNFNESVSRLNTTVAGLEEELASVKSKLDTNTEELRSALLRKDSDAKAYQDRIESLRNEMNSAKDDLNKRKTLIEQLEQNVELLKKQLSIKEQQLKVYESTNDMDSEANTEIKLRQELQKTKVELQNTLDDLNAANESIEQFKSVAGAAESRVLELTSSYDAYKKSVESTLNESRAANKELADQISELKDKTSALEQELDHSKSANETTVSSLQNEIEDLKVKASSSDEIRGEYEGKLSLIKIDLEQQRQIASERQKSYEEELQKHAEVSRLNTTMKENESILRIKIQELTVDARDSKTALIASQESWENQRLSLEEELKVAEGRVSDLNLQNRMLLNQLEQVTKQQKEKFADSSESRNLDTTDMAGSSEELMQVVSFLRHEKEISDAQLEISKQEQKRLQQNLEITKQELSDVTTELMKLKNQNEHSEKLEQNYKELKEKVNQLDILRESNATLRQECQRYSAQVRDLEQKLSVNTAKLEPLEYEIVNIKLELETKNKELESEKSIVEFWKNKNQEILQNYNRIDPEEHNKLRLQVAQMAPYAAQVEELKNKLTDLETGYQSERKKSIREANDRLTKFKGIIDVTKKELTEEKQKTTELQLEIETLQKSLEDTSKSIVADEGQTADALAPLSKELEEMKQLLGKTNEEWQQKLTAMTLSRDEFQKQVDELRKELNSTANSSSIAEIEALKAGFEKEKQELIKQKNDELEKLRFKLKIEIRKELEGQSTTSPDIEALKKQLDAEYAANIDTLKKQLEVEHTKNVEEKVKDACDKLKAKIREPHENKINSIVNKRFEKLKLEAEIEIKRKEEELAKNYEEKLKGSSSSQELQNEINKLKQSLDEECKKAKEEGRALAIKEGEMRYKMTKRQLDKAKDELARLKAGSESSSTKSSAGDSKTNNSLPLVLNTQSLPSSVPIKPNVASSNAGSDNTSNNNINNNNSSGSRIPTHNFRENLKKPPVLKPQLEEENKNLKRSAEDVEGNVSADKSTEKKLKNA